MITRLLPKWQLLPSNSIGSNEWVIKKQSSNCHCNWGAQLTWTNLQTIAKCECGTNPTLTSHRCNLLPNSKLQTSNQLTMQSPLIQQERKLCSGTCLFMLHPNKLGCTPKSAENHPISWKSSHSAIGVLPHCQQQLPMLAFGGLFQSDLLLQVLAL